MARTPAPVPRVSYGSLTSGAVATLDACDDSDAPHRFLTLDNICNTGAAPIPKAKEVHFAGVDEPTTFAEAEQCKCW